MRLKTEVSNRIITNKWSRNRFKIIKEGGHKANGKKTALHQTLKRQSI